MELTMVKRKVNLSDKAQKLEEQIQNAKEKLVKLKQQRKMEIGTLALKHGLDKFDDDVLDANFKRIAEETA